MINFIIISTTSIQSKWHHVPIFVIFFGQQKKAYKKHTPKLLRQLIYDSPIRHARISSPWLSRSDNWRVYLRVCLYVDVYLQVVHLSTLRIDLWITDQLNADKVLAFYHSVMTVTHGDPRVIHIDINSPWSMLSVFFIKHTEPRGLLSQLKYCTHCSHFWT